MEADFWDGYDGNDDIDNDVENDDNDDNDDNVGNDVYVDDEGRKTGKINKVWPSFSFREDFLAIMASNLTLNKQVGLLELDVKTLCLKSNQIIGRKTFSILLKFSVLDEL